MIDFKEARIVRLAVHRVGNKVKDQGYIAAEKECELNGDIVQTLQSYFLNPFKKDEFF